MNADQSDQCVEKQVLTGIQLAGLFSAVDESIFGAGVSICGHRRKLPPTHAHRRQILNNKLTSTIRVTKPFLITDVFNFMLPRII